MVGDEPTPSAAGTRPAVRVGTQGWNYADWVGPLYPTGTRPRDFLSIYARAFDTVEVDSTFYAIPGRSTVRGWAERTPPGFVFSLKLPREITHERRLVGAEGVLEEFCDRARELGDRLGPILIQLGPDFGPGELPALEEFLATLPSDLRFALEFRQSGWFTPETYDLLRNCGVALALSDGRWSSRETLLSLVGRPTAPFQYIRWMGPDRRITSFARVQVDREAEIALWAEALRRAPASPFQVFGYFNNHFSGHSPASARSLQRRLGQRAVEPAALTDQISLF